MLKVTFAPGTLELLKRKSNGSLWLPLFMSCIITKPLKAECAEYRKSVCDGSVPSPPEL